MKLEVTVKPGASRPGVAATGVGTFTVRVRERAREGRANEAVLEALAGHFGVAKSRVLLRRGLRSRNKIVEILGAESRL